jgi:hypothetical protein
MAILMVLMANTPMSFAQSSPDGALPSIRITKPTAQDTIVSNKILVQGTAYDNENGIHKVEAFIHPVPFDGELRYQLAAPIAPGDWSSWSIELDVNEPGTHKIIVQATNELDKPNWYEVTVNIPFLAEDLAPDQAPNYKHKIALVEPTFTSAAYGPGGFYEFYPKYKSVPAHLTVSQDLDLLTAELPDVYDQQVDEYYKPLIDGIQESFPDAMVAVIRDEDIHDGNIFNPNGDNAYDVLILLHDEYVTPEIYDNYRDFAAKGGTLVLVDPNTFYAKVSYDRVRGTVTLVDGHDWKFNGHEARKSVGEYYAKNNTEFIGSNYVVNQITDDITFDNNPFNYTHFEENQLLNPNAIILHDFGMTLPPDYPNLHHLDATVATYEMKYGEGKVIALGIFGTTVIRDENFLDFWTDVVLLHALAPRYNLEVNSQEYSAYWKMNTGNVRDIVLDVETKSLIIELDRISQTEDTLLISLPRQLIDANGSVDSKLGVMIDGVEISHDELLYSHTRVLSIPLNSSISKMQIYGTQVLPEFSLLPAVLLVSFTSVFFVSRLWRGAFGN